MRDKMRYEVSWDGKLTRYRQEFESLEEARMALVFHQNKNAVIHITLKDK